MTKQEIDECLMACANQIAAHLNQLRADGHYEGEGNCGIQVMECKGISAGWAHFKDRVIELNVYIMNQQREDFLPRTPGHELAHILAWELFEDKGHGEGWKTVMGWLDINPHQFHNYDICGYSLGPGVHRRWNWVCRQCGANQAVATGRHNKMLKPESRDALACGTCSDMEGRDYVFMEWDHDRT